MSGRGRLDEVEEQSHPGIYMLRDSTWLPAEEPLHTDKPERCGAGLGMSFAITVIDTTRQPIGLIPCAVGGSPLSRWMPGADLYENAVRLTKEALKSGHLKGILWHQGESDSGEAMLAESYGTRLEEMIHALRSELNAEEVPFIAGALGPFLKDHAGSRFYEIVNKRIQDAEQHLQNYTVVSSEGLTDNGDDLHFDARSVREFGLRYAKAFLAWQKTGPT